jgi:hypothetical protein
MFEEDSGVIDEENSDKDVDDDDKTSDVFSLTIDVGNEEIIKLV